MFPWHVLTNRQYCGSAGVGEPVGELVGAGVGVGEPVGELVTVPFDVDDFDSIEVSNGFDAFIEIGDTTLVEVIVNEGLIEKLDIRVRNGELKIGLKSGVSVNNGSLEAMIQVPSLEEIEVSGSGSTDIVGFDGDSLVVDISGASDLTVEGTATTVSIDGSGAGNIDVRLDGVQTATIDLSGARSLDLAQVDRVTGDMSGASSMRVPAHTDVDVDTSGASSISRS